jgi:hypothetical protein
MSERSERPSNNAYGFGCEAAVGHQSALAGDSMAETTNGRAL